MNTKQCPDYNVESRFALLVQKSRLAAFTIVWTPVQWRYDDINKVVKLLIFSPLPTQFETEMTIKKHPSESRDSDYTTGWPTEESRFDSRQVKGIFFISITSRLTLGSTQPLVQLVPGIKRQGREADHSLLSSAEFKNSGAIPPLPIHDHGVMIN
jgi:hypothetical protein